LLLRQLLPDICQAAGDLLSSTPRVCKSTEMLQHKTLDFTPDVASQQTKPVLCRLQIIASHAGMHLSETTRDVMGCGY